MKPISIVAPLLFAATAVQAVTMDFYAPTPRVTPAFETYLKTFYEILEDPDSTSTYTDLYAKDGQAVMGLPSQIASGSVDILQQKQMLLRPGGQKDWWYIVNGGFVQEETPEETTLAVFIVLQTTDRTNPEPVCTEAYGVAYWTFGSFPVVGGGGLKKYNLTESAFESPSNAPSKPAPACKWRKKIVQNRNLIERKLKKSDGALMEMPGSKSPYKVSSLPLQVPMQLPWWTRLTPKRTCTCKRSSLWGCDAMCLATPAGISRKRNAIIQERAATTTTTRTHRQPPSRPTTPPTTTLADHYSTTPAPRPSRIELLPTALTSRATLTRTHHHITAQQHARGAGGLGSIHTTPVAQLSGS
ncbi:hypothetical protein HYFRA_00013985 [Hymenoscyphus fraxineus]|uniref:SnoaL-like domain-containing protein n=1 Tax=Hymenoscyphus fraxineus TaxID=746836 RepID=A0A9N9LA00_9HELO|nr:hypothetical protein HYFRA_00013985 [Hymenoscyphus fraxineus]